MLIPAFSRHGRDEEGSGSTHRPQKLNQRSDGAQFEASVWYARPVSASLREAHFNSQVEWRVLIAT